MVAAVIRRRNRSRNPRRRTYIEGQTEVLDWAMEETLLYGIPRVRCPQPPLCTRADWIREWHRWREVVLPKCISHLPGRRPFAMYAVGEIPPREVLVPLPTPNRWATVTVPDGQGGAVTHCIDHPEPFVRSEVNHLRQLGIVDAAEFTRYREWLRGDRNGYPLEMSLYE